MAPDPVVAVTLLEDWTSRAPQASPAPVPVDAEHLAIEAEKGAIVTAALGALGGDTASEREALTFLVDALENAVFVGEVDVMAACRPAAARLLTAGMPASPLRSMFDALLTAVEGRFPSAQRLIDESRGLPSGSPG